MGTLWILNIPKGGDFVDETVAPVWSYSMPQLISVIGLTPKAPCPQWTLQGEHPIFSPVTLLLVVKARENSFLRRCLLVREPNSGNRVAQYHWTTNHFLVVRCGKFAQILQVCSTGCGGLSANGITWRIWQTRSLSHQNKAQQGTNCVHNLGVYCTYVYQETAAKCPVGAWCWLWIAWNTWHPNWKGNHISQRLNTHILDHIHPVCPWRYTGLLRNDFDAVWIPFHLTRWWSV